MQHLSEAVLVKDRLIRWNEGCHRALPDGPGGNRRARPDGADRQPSHEYCGLGLFVVGATSNAKLIWAQRTQSARQPVQVGPLLPEPASIVFPFLGMLWEMSTTRTSGPSTGNCRVVA